MQNLRKKTSPLKYKNETGRFMGEGVSFKAKLIGILEVSEARGDRMCQEALSDLKMAIRAAGEHKQRIIINIAIDGLRLRDEKTGDCLYHHPVHKISFIAQDMTDSRAFGYIFGSPDTGHRFFGIKTDKAASQVVIAMRDLFQVVFALKKKEIELAKQHLERSSPLFSDGSITYAKQLQNISHVSVKSSTEPKHEDCTSETKNAGAAVADLVDLELELNSLQQGLTQMERITPLDPFNARDDPFGDSFIAYPMKPILPPPPGTGRERSNRNSDSSSVFSPKTPHLTTGDSISDKKNFTFSQDFNSSHEDHSSGDWFNSTGTINIFEEPAPLPLLEPTTKDEKHEKAKQEIMSQFDVFTELDPLELKNPPKKALNELTSKTTQEQPLFNTSFNQNTQNSRVPTAIFPPQNVFNVDPFGEDPFVREDPFADSDFSKQDPFDNEFSLFSTTQDASSENKGLLKSPKRTIREKSKSPLFKNNTIDITFEKYGDSVHRLSDMKGIEIPFQLDCAPEPPPRPSSMAMQITPPPLPPKKVFSGLSTKPPPRPPHNLDESPYDFIDKYEVTSTIEVCNDSERNPPLPLPARKAKFDVEFSSPERPLKLSNLSSSQEEDYLTPINFSKQDSVILLPPPHKNTKKLSPNANLPDTDSSSNGNLADSSLDGLDITLSQLTLTGLSELAQKLHIPASQLSNMTLVQLTNFLSNYIRSNATKPMSVNSEENLNVNKSTLDVDFPSFKADFAANFNNFNNKPGEGSYDRYAVFRELMQEEIKQTKIDSEPEEILEEKVKMDTVTSDNIILNLHPLRKDNSDAEDKYAALREIVENELKQCEILKPVEREKMPKSLNLEDKEEGLEKEVSVNDEINETENIANKIEEIIKSDSELTAEGESSKLMKGNINEVSPSKEDALKTVTPPDIPTTVTTVDDRIANEINAIPSTARLTSGSLSDIVSGSSPEIDQIARNLDIDKKTLDKTGESWAVFDQTTNLVDSSKEKQPLQSEEGVSPWSSDSKEFGNCSPSERRSKDSSGPDLRSKKGKGKKGQDGWWDTSAEPGHYSSNRRSTDSYDEDYYDCYDKPRRRRYPYNWQHTGHATGGHSSSSRDVSPWEEEPQLSRLMRDGRHPVYRHSRGPSFDKYRDRKSNDSWDDDEDDYEYDDEDRRYHWSRRHGPRDADREGRQSGASRNLENDRRIADWNEESRHHRRREARDRRCCPDWEQAEHDKPVRYAATRRSNQDPSSHGKWRSRKHEEKCCPRESQESPWEDEYTNEPEHIYYTTSKRSSKSRPSSASEIDRKTGEIKTKHYLQSGGSDGEWDKRHKPSRRSRSRDSQYSEPGYRYKCDPTPPSRTIHRSKTLSQTKPQDAEFLDKKNSDFKDSNRKRKKLKDASPKMEENLINTFPRRSSSRGKKVPTDDFNATEEMVVKSRQCQKFNFENDFDISELESPAILNPVKSLRQRSLFNKQTALADIKMVQRGVSLKESKILVKSSKSMFEDDFSPTDKIEDLPDDSICSIKEETDRDEIDDFEELKFKGTPNNGRKLKLGRNRLLSNLSLGEANDLKKSESVNIFQRDDDPFDDDFFYDESAERDEEISPRNVELRWSEDFKNT